jgi:hypothetical protein
MNIKRLGIGSVVAAITLYFLGMLFWENLFTAFFAANAGSATGVWRETPILWAQLVGTLLYALLLTLAMETRGVSKSPAGGLTTGLVVGALLWGTVDISFYGLTNMNTLAGSVADVALEAVRAGIAGFVAALVLSKVGD